MSDARTPALVAPVVDARRQGAAVEKVTLYLPTHVVHALEVLRVELLVQHGVKISRSHLATVALQTAIDELQRELHSRAQDSKAPPTTAASPLLQALLGGQS